MNREGATVVGLSTEGYMIAKALASKKVPVAIVDESLQMGHKLQSIDINAYPSLSKLAEEEPLIDYEPLDDSVAMARNLFFAPKIRGSEESLESEILLRLRNTCRALAKGATFFNLLPMGPGGNGSLISILEKMTGLTEGEGFGYVHLPVKPLTTSPYATGISSAQPSKSFKEVTKALELAGVRPPPPLRLESSELLHTRRIISLLAYFASELEVYSRIGDPREEERLKKLPRYKEVYLDELAEHLFDLKIVAEKLVLGDPLVYLTTGSLKSISGYTKRLAGEVKLHLRNKGIKTSAARVVMAWSLDRFEMRGERLALRSELLEKFRDQIGESVAQDEIIGARVTSLGYSGRPEKTNLVVVCSLKDFENELGGGRVSRIETERILFKANLICEPVE